jgi:hypothetical protein
MASTLKFMLGLVPSAENIEKKNNELLEEYNKLQEFIKSEKLARFNQLTNFIGSKEFADKKNYYQSLVFNGSDEQKKETHYLTQKKSQEVKFYYKYKSSADHALFEKMDGSKTIDDYEKLKAFIESPQFKKVEEYMKDKKKFEKTQEFQKYQEYKALSVNSSFINYFKFVKDKASNDYINLQNSPKIAVYEALEKYVLSGEFTSLKNSLKKKEFHASDAYRKFTEYKQLKKSKELANYYKMAKSPFLTDFKKLNGSEELKFYKELESFVKSPEYAAKKKEIESLRFENTDEYAKLKDYNNQTKSAEIKGYYRIKASKELDEYIRINNSKLIPDYEALEKYIISDEFKNRKTYLLDTKKWEKTDEYKEFVELETLKKDQQIVWYLKIKDSKKFDEVKAWNLIFEDDFTTGKLDSSKWITKYFYGEVLLNDTYALPGEKHLFNNDKNLQINGSSLKINTRKEKVSGKEWNPLLGFYPREFEFTSGIINTGSSFRTKYGKIEAKIKINPASGVLHAFWLSGETMVPQIDIFKCIDNKLYLSSFWGDPTKAENIQKDSSAVSAGIIKGKYMIFTFEWSPETMNWKFNNQLIKSQTNNIPSCEMYVSINSGVVADNADVASAGLEVDWIRCYQKN